MFNGLCHIGNSVSLGTFGAWGGLAMMILNMVFWLGLFAGLTLLVVRAIQRTRVPAATVQDATGQPSAKEILQSQYARGEITREQYKSKIQDIR